MATELSTPSGANGKCPVGWRDMPLSFVTELRVSNVDKKSKSGERAVRLCNYTDVYNNDYIDAGMDFMRATATVTEIGKFGLAAGDVIITKDSETPDDIGVSAVVNTTAPDLVCGYHLAVLRPNQEEVDPTFLGKQLGDPRIARYFGQQANGSTRYGLSAASIEKTRIWLPDLSVQEAIGRIAHLLDAAIAKTTAVIAKLKQVRAGLLHDLLTRGLDANGELRDPLKHPARFKDSPLGRIPKEWDCKLLLDPTSTKWFTGGTPNRSQSVGWTGSIPFLTPKDMKVFEISDTIEHVTELAAQCESRLMPAETVFIVVRGMILAHTFPVCLSTKPFAFNQDVKAVRGGSSIITRFLGYWFAGNSNTFLRKATEATHGTKKLDMSEINRVLIACPSLDEQKLLVKRIELAGNCVSKYESEYTVLQQLKNGLMSDLLTGRVPVPENIETGSA